MITAVEVGGWEHDCCGPSYERNSIVKITCRILRDERLGVRYVESHHDAFDGDETDELRGRIADIQIVHPDGDAEPILRLPSGRSLRGFDDEDDGHLEHAYIGESVTHDSESFVIILDA